MKALTWTRESHGLFDYESSSIKKKDLKFDASTQIVRIGDIVESVAHQEEMDQDESITSLFNLVEETSRYFDLLFRRVHNPASQKGKQPQ
jgi:hypothetical protein